MSDPSGDVLLDTHALLWWLIDSPLLSAIARDQMGRPDCRLWVSAASVWEIATKHRIGKLPEADRVLSDLPTVLNKSGMRPLPIAIEHAVLAGRLDGTHKDPFDRMLIAQARLLGYPVISRNPVFAAYGVPVIW